MRPPRHNNISKRWFRHRYRGCKLSAAEQLYSQANGGAAAADSSPVKLEYNLTPRPILDGLENVYKSVKKYFLCYMGLWW